MTDKRAKRGSRERSIGRKVFRAVIFLVPIVIFLPTWGGKIALPPGADTFSDLLITHYPNLLFLRESLLHFHQLPLWSSLIHSGAPFAANPLAGLFYLPGWIAMIFPLPAGLSLALAAHAVFGTWGMYRFLRLQEVGEPGSILGALGFGLMPKIAAHFGAGHVSLIYAISWTPWLLSCSTKDSRGWRTGMTAGMLFLADPRWSIYAGLLWLAFDIAHRQLSIRQRIELYGKISLIAFLVAAPLIIPMFEYIGLATRAELNTADLLLGSMPAAQLAGILIPGSGGNLEWYWYCGGSAVVLLVYGLFKKRFREENRFWVACFILGIVFSFGTFGFDIVWLSKIPILNLVRVPARALFISGISLAILIGRSIDHLVHQPVQELQIRSVPFGLFAAGLLMSLGLGIATGLKTYLVIWGFLFWTVTGLMFFLFLGKLSSSQIVWIFGAILLIDLAGAGLASYQVQEYEKGEPELIITYLAQDEEMFRIYSPSYSLPQDQAAGYGFQLADGIDPMQIASYADFMEAAGGVERDGYSVTIPPFRTGDPSRDNLHAEIDNSLLGLLNVKYIVSEFELDHPGLALKQTVKMPLLYQNEQALPRAWIEEYPGDQRIPERSEIRGAAVLFYSPNRISLEVEGPGRLVLSEIYYPGWKVFVDGEQASLEKAHQVLRSVNLPEGKHAVNFLFRPLSVYSGLILAAVGWISLAFLGGRKK